MKRFYTLSVGLMAMTSIAADYYVATSGSDTNAGTFAAPFATVQHAVDFMGAGDTCYDRGGTYRQVVDLSGASSST